MSVKIPKKIMQTYKTTNIPEKWKNSPVSIKKYMPEWEYHFMTDEDNLNFVIKYFPDFLPTFQGFKYPIQRADAIRYMWLYINGGLYLDLDFEVQKPLDELFYEDAGLYLIGSGNVGSFLTNSFMASKPRAKVWLAMLEHMKKPMKWYWFGKHFQVMNTTGPNALTWIVKQECVSYVALPGKYIMPCSVCNLDVCTAEGAYLKPLEGSSWIGWDTKIYNFGLCYWQYLVVLLLVIIVIIIILLLRWIYRRYFY